MKEHQSQNVMQKLKEEKIASYVLLFCAHHWQHIRQSTRRRRYTNNTDMEHICNHVPIVNRKSDIIKHPSIQKFFLSFPSFHFFSFHSISLSPIQCGIIFFESKSKRNEELKANTNIFSSERTSFIHISIFFLVWCVHGQLVDITLERN